MCFSYKTDTVIIAYATYILSSFVMLVHIVARKEKVKFDMFYVILLLFFAWCLASNIWSIDFGASIISTITMAELTIYGLIFYEFLKYSDIDSEQWIKAIGYSVLAMGIYSLFYYGVNFFFESIISGHRLGLEINQENLFSSFAGFGCLIWLGLFCSKSRLSYLLFGVFSLILILAGGSRGSLVVTVVCLCLLYFSSYKKTRISWNKILICCLIITPLLYLFYNYGDRLDVIQRMFLFMNIFSSADDADGSALTRLDMIRFGFFSFLDRPIEGYGLNCYRILLLQYMGRYTYSHNNFIEILCNLGLVGFLLHYWIYAFILKLKKMNNLILFVMVIYVLFDGMFAPNYSFKLLYIIFALFCGTIKNNYITNGYLREK